MNNQKPYVSNGINIRSAIELADSDLSVLTQAMIEPQSAGVISLEGRGNVARLKLSDGLSVVVKRYSRGGLLSLLLGTHFLKLKILRCQQEFEFLARARSIGVNAPEPLAYAWRGNLWYEAWLVTREIPDALSLAELSRKNIDLGPALSAAAQQVLKLIDQRIFHVDLHPGNILIDPVGKAFVLDFDKAMLFHGKKSALRDLYLSRWRRAAMKHGLPDPIVELMSLELRRRVD